MRSVVKARSYSSSSTNPFRVLIVGAGLAGLSVAQALRQNGITSDVIESHKNIRFDGAGIAIPANGSWALEKLEIDITPKARTISKMSFTDERSNLLVDEKIDGLHPYNAQFYSMNRAELIDILLSKLIGTDIPIYTGVTIEGFSEDNHEVTVDFANGETKAYDLMITMPRGIARIIRAFCLAHYYSLFS